jgi:hypothetical protein
MVNKAFPAGRRQASSSRPMREGQAPGLAEPSPSGPASEEFACAELSLKKARSYEGTHPIG